MKKLKKVMYSGLVFVFVLGTLAHFFYQWSGKNAIVGFFAPINESTWEHMKLVFFPMLLFSLYSYKSLKNEYPNILPAMFGATLFGTFLIPVLFYTYTGILGFNIAIIDIGIFYISVFVSLYLAEKFTLSGRLKSYKTVLVLLLIMLLVAFIIFTVFQPNIALFISP